MLEDYRSSFSEAYEHVFTTMREKLQLHPTGRPTKSTGSIIEKLHRESIRLTQIQDIAGCRVVGTDVAEQDRVVRSLGSCFPEASIVDRRPNPSHGYRAVHVIVPVSGRRIEIQVRSTLQHLWAEFSERLADELGSELKYGGGDELFRRALTNISTTVADFEGIEAMARDFSRHEIPDDQTLRSKVQSFIQSAATLREQVFKLLNDAIRAVDDAAREVKKR
ncbi:MAG: hypothetical protein GEU77_16040 [Deltaproteobacteria bacterium]|nr:hypothetical protein [Deltaproteobacteria bacterium]